MILDTDTPLLENLYIDGLLTVDPSREETTINAKNIWIQRGGLYAGDEETPFPGKFNIVLHGSKNDPDMLVDPDLFANNKVLVNTGALNLYGTIPTFLKDRLTATAFPGDTTITMGDTTGLEVGDVLLLTATELNWNSSEEVNVVSVDSETEVTVTPALGFLHYGSTEVTLESRIGDMDMRAWAIKMNRDITITKDDIDWGCRVITTKYTDYEVFERYDGSATLQAVAIKGCGKENSDVHALEFYNNKNDTNVVTHSVIEQSDRFCVKAAHTDNLVFNDNVMFDCIQMGVFLESVDDYSIDNSVAVKVAEDP